MMTMMMAVELNFNHTNNNNDNNIVYAAVIMIVVWVYFTSTIMF